MIVLLVAVGEAFLPQLFTEFAVGMDEPRAALRQGVLLKDIRNMVEQSCHCEKYFRRCRSALPFQKALCVTVPLLCRLGQPLDALFFVTLDDLSLEQQLSQQILCMGIPSLGGGVDVIHGLAGVPSYRVSLQIFLSQTIERIVVSVVGGMLQPLDAKLEILENRIIR